MRRRIFLIAAIVAVLASWQSPTRAQQVDGSVWAWGYNLYGQVGGWTNSSSWTPVPVGGLFAVTAVAGGDSHSLALKSDGTVWAWGSNFYGQLGDGTRTGSSTPAQASGLSGVIAVDGSGSNSVALKSDGTVWAWGQIFGLCSFCEYLIPTQVIGLSAVTSVRAGEVFTLAKRADNTFWAWGVNSQGQLGDGTITYRSTPVQVSGLSNDVRDFAAGANHSLAVKWDGTVVAWGGNNLGQLGNISFWAGTPIPVISLVGCCFTAVAAGNGYSLALRADGTVWSWGEGNSTAFQVNGLSGIIALAARGDHRLALKSDGTVWEWGRTALNTNFLPPTQVAGLVGITAIGVGRDHALAIGHPTATLNSTTATFGDQPIGTISAPLPVTVTNNGGGLLNIAAVNFSNNDFYSTTTLPVSILPHASASLQVLFRPTVTGLRTGSMQIVDNAATSPESVSLTGRGVAPVVSLSTGNLPFGNQQVGTARTLLVRISNVGSGPLNITSLSFSTAEFFSTTPFPQSVLPGRSVAVAVCFKPTTTGPHTDLMAIVDNSGTSPERVALSGYGINPIGSDTVANAISHLKLRKPLLITMASTQGTLEADQAYWLSYDASVTPAAFDCQGFSRSWAGYHMARYTNASIDAAQVSCWGMQATITADSYGRLYLLAGGVTVARVWPLELMTVPFAAAEKFEHDLPSYLSVAGSDAALQSSLSSGPLTAYMKYQRVARMLEDVARYKPFIFRSSSWSVAETVMSTLITYLRNNVLNASATFGVASGDIETSAFVIRALYAYGSNSASLVDFGDISSAFMRDILPRKTSWSVWGPATRMQIMWVMDRRYWEGMSLQAVGSQTSDQILDAATDTLLNPVLREQMTDPSQWGCGVSRGWGGWIQSLQSNITCPPSSSSGYWQDMSNHLAIVQGLAESYRLLQREALLDTYPYYRDNAPWNLLASTAWVYQLGQQAAQKNLAGCIFDRWNNPFIDGPQTCELTAQGVQAVYEVLRSFDVQARMPYYSDYPATSPRTWPYANLHLQLDSSVESARFNWVRTGPQIYSDALYSLLGGYGTALGRFIF
jgi:Regulator of Chromosome Condensation (RCC1) repeat protein/regulator of chromosome condensation (RCC1) repeat-containing protein/HYDIN/CFA65/VesB family protein